MCRRHPRIEKRQSLLPLLPKRLEHPRPLEVLQGGGPFSPPPSLRGWMVIAVWVHPWNRPEPGQESSLTPQPHVQLLVALACWSIIFSNLRWYECFIRFLICLFCGLVVYMWVFCQRPCPVEKMSLLTSISLCKVRSWMTLEGESQEFHLLLLNKVQNRNTAV